MMRTNNSHPEARQLKSSDDVHELPKEFDRDGFSYRQIFATHPNLYIYEKRRGGYRGHEVVKARRLGGRVLNGRHFRAGWYYPSSAQWGVLGWTCQTLERALEKVREFSCATGEQQREAA
jgi:hypothetical protein